MKTHWDKVRQFETEISTQRIYNLTAFISFLNSKGIKLTKDVLRGIIDSLNEEDRHKAYDLLHEFVENRLFFKNKTEFFEKGE